jgi:type IV fimbrial biogenesis protein FimT
VLTIAAKAPIGGFSLIELMITLVILSLSLSYGISSYTEWVQNSQIRNAAESIQIGMQRARSEAVKLNNSVSFVLGNNTSWTVLDNAGTQLDARSGNEGSRNVVATVTPAGATTITYDSFGVVMANQAVGGVIPARPSQIDLSSSVLHTARALRVIIESPGGNVRICNPNATAGTAQAC